MPDKSLKVLMLGPDDTVLGGMTTVQQTYRQHWNTDRLPMHYIGIYCHGSKFKKLLVALRAMLNFIMKLMLWRPTIVHVHFSYKAGFYRESLFILVGCLFKFRVIAHAHAPDFEGFYDKQTQIAQKYIRFVLGRVTHLVVLSSVWQAYYGKLVPQTPISTLSNPVEIPEISHKTYTKPIVLTLGELGQRKGTYDLLKAIPLVIERHPQVEFWLGGDGDIEQVQAIIKRENLAEHVKLLGWIAGAAKHRALSEASIFVLPTYHEALPIAVLEAMAYRLPVITTWVGSLPDLFSNEIDLIMLEAGQINALADTLNNLIGNAEQCARLAQNAHYLMTKDFNPTVILDALHNLYLT